MVRGAALCRDLWFDRPQAIFGLYAAILAALGPSVEASSTAAAVYNAATAVALGVLGGRLFGRPAGAAAALAFRRVGGAHHRGLHRQRRAVHEPVRRGGTPAGPRRQALRGRRNVGAHLYWTEINRVPGALDAVLGAIDDPRRCPKYVVRVQAELERPGRAAAFWERIERRFEPEAEIRGLVLYRRVGDYPIAEER